MDDKDHYEGAEGHHMAESDEHPQKGQLSAMHHLAFPKYLFYLSFTVS